MATVLRPELGLLAPGLVLGSGARRGFRLLVPTVIALALFALWIKQSFGAGLWLAPVLRIDAMDSHWVERWSALARAGMGGLWGLALAPGAIYGLYRVLADGDQCLLGLVICSLLWILVGTASGIGVGDGLLHVVRAVWILLAAMGLEGVLRARGGAPPWIPATAACGLAILVGRGLPPADEVLPDQSALLAWADEPDKHWRTVYAREGAALAYLSDRRVLSGLMPRLREDGVDAGLPALVHHLQPDYLLLEVAREGLGQLLSDDSLARTYYPVQRFSRSGETERNPGPGGLPRRAPKDLLLMRRGSSIR